MEACAENSWWAYYDYCNEVEYYWEYRTWQDLSKIANEADWKRYIRMYKYTSWWAEEEVTLDMAKETSCFEYYNPQLSEDEWKKIQKKFRNACKEVYQMTPEEFAQQFGDDE